MKNYIQQGDAITFTAAAAIVVGEMVKIGGVCGIAVNDAASGDDVVVQFEGVFEVPKEAEAITPGTALYFKAGTKTVTATATSNTYCGFAANNTAIGDATCFCRLLW